MAYPLHILEEELKNKVRADYFDRYDATPIVGRIDFAVAVPERGPQLFEKEFFLWAEAKKGNNNNIYHSLVQLILTIGKARTFDTYLPPAFLGAFDAEKIAFVSYSAILDIFSLNDFNWNVTPSDHTTREFKTVLERVQQSIEENMLLFRFHSDDTDLRRFIKSNFRVGLPNINKIRINKTNFTAIYQRWASEVKPTIGVNWEAAKKEGIIDADFYLADILSSNDLTLREKLYVLLRSDHYELDRQVDNAGFFNFKRAEFTDEQKAHLLFWNRYRRPPKREYWDYIVARRDLLVPQDVRERNGSFFTPQRWVQLSQQYLADELGENWQEEYFIWDCAAGTGNLLAGLTNKYNIWASTLDQADVDVMKDRIKRMNDASSNGNGANLLYSHVFRFDFLNDPFDKLPESLKAIIDDEEKRKKLIIYINPPYAEASNARTRTGAGNNRRGLSESAIKNKYHEKLGPAANELFAQFFIRIFYEISGCTLAEFSTLKILQASNFRNFRQEFEANLKRGFIVPASSFDNVRGEFPIGFYIWDLKDKRITYDYNFTVYDYEGNFLVQRRFHNYDGDRLINSWYRNFYDQTSAPIGIMNTRGNDFQNQNYIYISSEDNHNHTNIISINNLIPSAIYYSIRHCIRATWLNDRDQFLYPKESWVNDTEFHYDCLAFTLFSNNIRSEYGPNHWIPFSEDEVGAQEKFSSHFMHDFIMGRLANNSNTNTTLFVDELSIDLTPSSPIAFSSEAQAVLTVGRDLWRYYHKQPNANPDASLYDIRLFFQGARRLENGRMQMNNDSTDAKYNEMISTLRSRLRDLARKIATRVYAHGFLKR